MLLAQLFVNLSGLLVGWILLIGPVNTTSPNTEKWLRKLYDENNGYGKEL